MPASRRGDGEEGGDEAAVRFGEPPKWTFEIHFFRAAYSLDLFLQHEFISFKFLSVFKT